MSIDFSRLLPLGWGNHFSAQIPLERFDSVRPARVIGVERDRFRVDAGDGSVGVTVAGRIIHEAAERPTIGDWVLLAGDTPLIIQRLERRTLIARRVAGGSEQQAIAANIDCLIVVCGLDGDFNLHRIERYLVLAAQAGVTPLVLLTKADLAEAPELSVSQVRKRLPPGAEVLAIDALRDPLTALLSPWLSPGITAVVVGSSGAGKSTVINTLAGAELQLTGATRRDAKGRHTTTARSLIRLPGGACIIDVPGMREVGLSASEGGVDRQFRTVSELACGCRFADCTHQEEPGCAVRQAVERGEVDADEWAHYLKLLAEERHNVAEHEKRQRERVFGKMVREALDTKRKQRRR